MPSLPLCLAPGLLGDMIIKRDEVVNLNIIEGIDYPGLRRRFAVVPLVGTFSQYLLLQHMVFEVEAGRAIHEDEIDYDLFGGVWFEFFDNASYPDIKTCAVEYLREYRSVCCEHWNMK